MLQIEDIIEIRKAEIYDRGYEIVFPNNKIIWLTKRRTIAGLLLLIKYEICSEEDLEKSKIFSREKLMTLGFRIAMEMPTSLLVNYGQKKDFPQFTLKDFKAIENMFYIKKIMILSLTPMQKLFGLRLAILIE